MGTTGTHPSEDDDAFEFYTPIMDKISASLQKALSRPLTTAKSLGRGGLAEARVAALLVEVLMKEHFYNHEEDLELAIKRMDELAANEEVTAPFREASRLQAQRLKKLR